MEQNFHINQKVWVIEWNVGEGAEDRRSVDMEYRVAEYRITGVNTYLDWNTDGTIRDEPTIRYELADEIGNEPKINNMNYFHQERRDWNENEVHDSYDSAVLEIVQKINSRMDDLERMKTNYLNLLEEHKRENQLIDDELFQMFD